MKKYFKILLIFTLLICIGYGLTYATEEDGRFVDIPVPPASSGRADFTSEEGQEQSKIYEEAKNEEQTNSEVLEENFILYKGTGETSNNTVEENAMQNQETRNDDYVENIDAINEEIIVDNNNKVTIICAIVVIAIMVIMIIKKMSKRKK